MFLAKTIGDKDIAVGLFGRSRAFCSMVLAFKILKCSDSFTDNDVLVGSI